MDYLTTPDRGEHMGGGSRPPHRFLYFGICSNFHIHKCQKKSPHLALCSPLTPDIYPMLKLFSTTFSINA